MNPNMLIALKESLKENRNTDWQVLLERTEYMITPYKKCLVYLMGHNEYDDFGLEDGVYQFPTMPMIDDEIKFNEHYYKVERVVELICRSSEIVTEDTIISEVYVRLI